MQTYIYTTINDRGFFIPEEEYENVKNNDPTQFAHVIVDNKYGTVLKNKHGRNFRDNWKKTDSSIDKVEYANK